MKIGIFSDMHMGPYGDRVLPSNGLNARMCDYQVTMRNTLGSMAAEDCEVILFGGDAFKDKSGKPNPTQLKMFGGCLSEWGIPIHMITGNHDLPRASGEHDALACFEWIDKVRVWRNPRSWNLGKNEEIQIIFLPYPNRNAFMANEAFKNMSIHEANETIQALLIDELHSLASKLDPNKPSILLAHVALAESKAGSESMMMMGKDICLSVFDIPSNINYAFFGHIHKPQELEYADSQRKVYVIGSPESVDFGEENDTKRWLLLDTDAGTVESIPTNPRRYKTIAVGSLDDRPLKGAFGNVDVEGAIVRIHMMLRKNQQVDIQGMRNKLMEKGAFSVKFEREYIPEDRDTSMAESSGIESQTQADVLKEYCVTKNITGDRAKKMVETGLSIMEAHDAV